MTVGIFGGSFNPVHKGHVGIAQQLLSIGLLDEVWFMVSPLNPLKQAERSDILPLEHRLCMARMATAEEPHLRVSDFEAHLPLPSYTVVTLAELQRSYPDTAFALIVGEDNWLHFDRWYHADDIRRQYDIFVYGRSSTAFIDFHPAAAGTVRSFRPLPLFDVSSTRIRQALRTGQLDYARRWLHPAVFRYLCQHQLYSPLNSFNSLTPLTP